MPPPKKQTEADVKALFRGSGFAVSKMSPRATRQNPPATWFAMPITHVAHRFTPLELVTMTAEEIRDKLATDLEEYAARVRAGEFTNEGFGR